MHIVRSPPFVGDNGRPSLAPDRSFLGVLAGVSTAEPLFAGGHLQCTEEMSLVYCAALRFAVVLL